MKKIKLYKIRPYFVSLLLGIVVVSCQEDESLPRGTKPTVSLKAAEVTTVEGEDAVFTLELSKPITSPVQFRIEVLGGTAKEGEDFDMSGFDVPSVYEGEFGYMSQIPAYASSAEIAIPTLRDILPEGTKQVKLKLTSILQAQGVFPEPTIVTVNIQNYVGNELITRLEWAGDYLPGNADPCEELDFDLELYNANDDLIDDSYTSCPEEITIPGDAPNGKYYMVPSLWTHNGNDYAINPPVKVVFIRPGVFTKEVNLSSKFLLEDGGIDDGNLNAFAVFEIEKTTGKYKILDQNSALVVEGKMKRFVKPTTRRN